MTFTNHLATIRDDTRLREARKAWRKAVLARLIMQDLLNGGEYSGKDRCSIRAEMVTWI